MTKELLVQTKSADYPIYIGPQLLQHLDLYLKNLPGFIDAHQVFLIAMSSLPYMVNRWKSILID